MNYTIEQLPDFAEPGQHRGLDQRNGKGRIYASAGTRLKEESLMTCGPLTRFPFYLIFRSLFRPRRRY